MLSQYKFNFTFDLNCLLNLKKNIIKMKKNFGFKDYVTCLRTTDRLYTLIHYWDIMYFKMCIAYGNKMDVR